MVITISTAEYALALTQMRDHGTKAAEAHEAYAAHLVTGEVDENSRQHSWQRESKRLWKVYAYHTQRYDEMEKFLADCDVTPDPEPAPSAPADACPVCDGTGYEPGQTDRPGCECAACDGTGEDDDPELWWGAGAGPATGHQRRSDGMAPISEPEIALTGNPAETVAKIERDPTDAELQETVDRYLRLAAAMIAAGQRDRAKRYRDKAEAALTQLKKRRAGIQPGEHPADHCAIAYPTLHRQIMNSQAGYV